MILIYVLTIMFLYFLFFKIPSYPLLSNFNNEIITFLYYFIQSFHDFLESGHLSQYSTINSVFLYMYYWFLTAFISPNNTLLFFTILIVCLINSESFLYFREQKYEFWRRCLTNKSKRKRWELVSVDFFRDEERSDTDYFDFLTMLTSVDGMSWRELRHLDSRNS